LYETVFVSIYFGNYFLNIFFYILKPKRRKAAAASTKKAADKSFSFVRKASFEKLL